MSTETENFNFSATGIGSVPFLDMEETCREILAYFTSIPFWPQFVQRTHLEDMMIQYSEGLPYSTLGGIAVSGETIYAYTNGAGLFKGIIHQDFSITWETDQKVIAEIYFAQVLKDPVNDSTIYASGYPGGIFKSTDNGETWHEKNFGMVSFKVEDPLRQGYYALDISESNPDVLYLGLFGKGVYRSSNGRSPSIPRR